MQQAHILLLAAATAVTSTPLSARQGTGASSDKPQKSVEERLADLEKQTGGDFMRAYWKDGMRFESPDKRYKLKIGGRVHYDIAYSSPDSDTEAAIEVGTTRINDGAELRRTRLELAGEVGERVEWATSLDFGSGATNFRNVYLGLKEGLFGASVRAGQFKEPFSLDQQTSSNNITFMERSLMNSFVPAHNAGLMVFDAVAHERLTWAVGAFRAGSDNAEVSSGDGEWAATGRLTGLPFIDEAGDDYLHLGLGISRRSPTGDAVTIAARPESNLTPAFVTTTGTGLTAETVELAGLEAGWVRGPLSVVGEYTLAKVDGTTGAPSDPDFSGYYAQVSYFLTGESRGYRKAQGCFDAIKPKENLYGREGGFGAIELAVRASSIDLEDDGINGGELDDLTFGVNWYLNANTRVMANYVRADLDPASGSDGTTDILEFRFQFAY
jgi:phosphate-selective porin OprO/OprP